MRVFNEIRATLLDLSVAGERKRQEIAQQFCNAKVVSGLAMVATASVTAISLLAMSSFTIIGGFFALLGIAGTIAAHEMYVLSSNWESMLSDQGIGDIVNIFRSVWSPATFTSVLTKDTWFVSSIFGTSIQRALSQE